MAFMLAGKGQVTAAKKSPASAVKWVVKGTGGKGVVKGKGSGKPAAKPTAKAALPVAPAAAAGPRTKLLKKRISGVVTKWKGKFGWITPDQPINHPEAAGKKEVFLGGEDVVQQLSGVGAAVSFLLYSDGKGVGAMDCKPAAAKPATAQGSAAGGWVFKPAAGKQSQPQKQAPKLKAQDQAKKPEDKSKRVSTGNTPYTGIIVKAFGQSAFIKPDEDMDLGTNPKTGQPKDAIYLHASDMDDGANLPNVGAKVVFFTFNNDKGLGAEHCQVLEDGPEPEKPEKSEKTKKQAKAADGVAKKLKKQPREPKEKGPSGPDLARERITTELVGGTITVWKKKFGFIKPTEALDHPDAEKHGGKLYFHANDLDGLEPAVGMAVQFHCYSDESGLGAEEIVAA